MEFDLPAYLRIRKGWVDEALATIFSPPRQPEKLFEAMAYSLMAGGKRIRPILMMATYELFRENGREILPFACSIEMVHTYSLIHDDLPAMDDDDLRRGKLTCHKVFGEAMAILAGDGLLTEAFRLLTEDGTASAWPAETRLHIIRELALGAGTGGMVGGQAMDILSEHQSVDLDTVRFIHNRKTGAMIRAAVRMGALLGNADAGTLDALTLYGENIGMAFQIVDDILDVEGNTAALGKEAGADEKLEKATYPHVAGMEEAKREASARVEAAHEALAPFDEKAAPLRAIADLILKRDS